MNRAGDSIGWADYTINPVKGKCPMACSYCYALRMYDRFKWNPEIRYDDWVWRTCIPKGSRIFVGSTMELFGDWIKAQWLQIIFDYCRACPSHTFIFLTKLPQNLQKWSPFPDNCYVGVTVTDEDSMIKARKGLDDIWAKVRFISFEPLLGKLSKESLMDIKNLVADWLIIGQQTPPSKKTEPKVEWIRDIVEAADKAGIPVFLKDNLLPLLKVQGFKYNIFWKDKRDKQGFEELHFDLRQEFPK